MDMQLPDRKRTSIAAQGKSILSKSILSKFIRGKSIHYRCHADAFGKTVQVAASAKGRIFTGTMAGRWCLESARRKVESQRDTGTLR